ncbi:MAG: hypothetical protein M3Y85_02710 [Bacteroidota bacterium]|nr:hypothetical protein [Bacteroidota bacterium]
MKSAKSLLIVVAIALLMAGCTATRNTSSEYFDEDVRTQQIGNRLYVQDPYYGTVILEKNPYTGRYYDVTNGYRTLSTPYYDELNTRDYRNTQRYYGNRSNSNYYNRSTSDYGNQTNGNGQRPSQEPSPKTRDEARKKVLGNSN